MASRAGRHGAARAGHRRSATVRGPAARPDVLAGRRRCRAADRWGAARRRLSRPSRSCGSPSRRRSRSPTPKARPLDARRTRRPTCCEERRSRAARSPSRSPGAQPDQVSRRLDRRLEHGRGPPAGPEPVRDLAPSTRRPGKRSEETAQVVITVPLPFADIEAPTLTVDQPADGATFENGAIPVQGTTTNATSVSVELPTYDGPPEAPRRSTAARESRRRRRLP